MKNFEKRVLKKLTELGPDKYLEVNSSSSMAVFQLRKELGKEYILTANRVGYRLNGDEGLRKAKEVLKRVSTDE
jgi:hypothetical protein